MVEQTEERAIKEPACTASRSGGRITIELDEQDAVDLREITGSLWHDGERWQMALRADERGLDIYEAAGRVHRAIGAVTWGRGSGGRWRDAIIGKLVEMGCASPSNLAGQLGRGVRPEDLTPELERLVGAGVLRRRESEGGPVYELARG